MPFRLLRKCSRQAARRTRRTLCLESLHDRTLLTYFAVSAVPDLISSGDATVSLTRPSDETPDVQVTLTLQAFPDGEGSRSGTFDAGIKSPFLKVDTTPAPGQKIGDPIAVSFDLNYLARLRSFLGWPPPEETYLSFLGRIDGGDVSDDLFYGSFTTNYTNGDETQEDKSYVINMNVGDSILVQVAIDGQAHSVANHYRDWVDFSAAIEVTDAAGSALFKSAALMNLPGQQCGTRPSPETARLEASVPSSRGRQSLAAGYEMAARPAHPAPDGGALTHHRLAQGATLTGSFDYAGVVP